MIPQPLISVIVCTYNRSGLLRNVLQMLGEQTLPPTEYEVIVVDNNSIDDTRAVAEMFVLKFPNFQYVFEQKQGLSHARNRGWQEARGEYVAYTDDDCKIPEQWLAVAKDIITRISPAVLGGPYYACFDSPKPRWWRDSYESHIQGSQATALPCDKYLDGGNIFFCRSLLVDLGGFDPKLGMTGQALGYGEETRLLQRIRVAMPEQMIYYDPQLYVYHLVRPEKMSLPWISQKRFANGRYSHQVFGSDTEMPRYKVLLLILRALLALVFSIARSVVRFDRVRYPFIQNYWFERTLRHVQALGALFEAYRQA